MELFFWLIPLFAFLGFAAVLLALGAVVMWLIGRRPGKHKVLKWISWSICGAFAIVGVISAGSWLLERPYGGDEREIDSLYMYFQAAFHDGDFQAAYSCMSPDYRQEHSVGQFEQDFAHLGELGLALVRQR